MFAPSFGQNFMAVLGIPLVAWITALGTGLAIERVVRAELANALLLPLGLAGSIALVYPLYALGSSDVLPVALLVIVTVAGLISARGGLRARLNPGLPGVAALGAYLLFMLPVLVAGHWLWLGYNYENDSSVQFMLTEALKLHGTQLVPQNSTGGAVIDTYLETGYPVGSHALLATLSGLLRTNPAVVYQGYLSSLAALIAVTVAGASTRMIGVRRAAVLGFAVAGANLFLQYAFQGAIKEVATAATTIAAFALVGEALYARRRYSGVVIAAFPLAATLCTYGAAGAPYVLACIAAAVAVLVIVERRLPRRTWVGPALLGAALVVVPSIPTINQFLTFFNVASAVDRAANPIGSVLGQLARPLPLSQISGVWLNGIYRLPVTAEPAARLTSIASAVILLLLIPGLLASVRRREPAPILAVVTTGLVLLVVLPQVAPYAAAKILAIASPVVVWVAGVGLCALSWRRVRPLVLAIGAALTLAIVVSDLLAYHDDQVSSTSRMLAMEAVGEHFAGRGPVLFNEQDPFTPYFADAAKTIDPFNSITPAQVQLLDGGNFYNQYFDLDQESLSYVESFPLIVTRRSPIESRPPSNFKLVYTNAYYDGWARQSRPRVLAHLPLQSEWSGTAVPPCTTLAALTQHAPRHSKLIQAVTPVASGFAVIDGIGRPFSWGGGGDSNPTNSIAPLGAGYVHDTVQVPVSGTYQAWVQGSFSRPVSVLVDDRTVGSVDGMDSVDQWSQAGLIHLSAGSHRLAILRHGGRTYPGDGTPWGEIGYVMLKKVGPEVLHTVPVKRWRSLCGSAADWIELVQR